MTYRFRDVHPHGCASVNVCLLLLRSGIRTFPTVLFFTLLSCCMMGCSVDRQQAAQRVIDSYPAPVPDSTATVFLPDLISQDGLDFNAAFSPDGHTFYFSRSKNRKYFILESTYRDGTWTAPAPSARFDTLYSNADPFVASNGDIYYISNRPKSDTDTTDDYDIYRLPKQGDTWGNAEYLSDINSDSTEYYVSVSDSGSIYFASYRDGNLDLYASRRTGDRYENPVNLGAVVNSTFDEHDPLIAPDESFLIFASTRPDGFGEADLYISFKQGNAWQAPRNMGSQINTPTYEYCPNLTPDGKFFFYSSELDVKWISADILDVYARSR